MSLKKIQSECRDIWIRLPKHKSLKSFSIMEDPVVLVEKNLYGHPLAGLLCERQLVKVLLKHGWEKVPNWEYFFVNREKGLFFSVYVDDIKLAGKKQNIAPRRKVNKTTEQLYKVATPCLDDHHLKEEENGSVGELSAVCAQIVLICLYLARIVRPDILRSANKLARAVTKRTKACDKRMARLISYISSH